MKQNSYISNLSLITLACLMSWFAWKDLRPWISAPWDVLIVAALAGAYLWHALHLRRLSRQIPQDYWDSIKQNPDLLRYERHRVHGSFFLLLICGLIVWRIVKDFHL